MESWVVGIIGMGDMGKLYARKLSSAGWLVHACDREENFELLQKELAGCENITVLRDGHQVSRTSDYILYNVEAGNIEQVVREYSKSTKLRAIVGGQTSCKAPEIRAFETYLHSHTEIISLHSLHGPATDPANQPLVIIPHRASPSTLSKVETLLICLQSHVTVMSAFEHDRSTANTQALMATIFLSLGTAFRSQGSVLVVSEAFVPYIVETAVTLVSRIYAQKWHVYAGLCIYNKFAMGHIDQYAKSAADLSDMIRQHKGRELCVRLRRAGNTLSTDKSNTGNFNSSTYSQMTQLNATIYFALLSTIDTWAALRIKPTEHLSCSTPQYRQWMSMVDMLLFLPGFLETLVEDMIAHSLHSKDFVGSAEGWAQCVASAKFVAFQHKFDETRVWFEMLEDGRCEEMATKVLDLNNQSQETNSKL